MIIVTITKNSSKTISDTIKSIENQSFKNIKWLVIDENSKDNTISKVKASKLKKKIIRTNKKGVFLCYNEILKFLKKNKVNDVIFFLHSDDLLYSNNTLLEINNIFKFYDIDALCGDVIFFKENKKEIFRKWISSYPKKQTKIHNKLYKFGNFYKKDFLFGWCFAHTSFFFHSRVINNIPFYDLDFKTSSDYGWSINLLLQNKIDIFYINKFLIRMRLGGTSTNLKNLFKQSINDYKIIKKIFYRSYLDNFYCFVILFFKKFIKLKQYF